MDFYFPNLTSGAYLKKKMLLPPRPQHSYEDEGDQVHGRLLQPVKLYFSTRSILNPRRVVTVVILLLAHSNSLDCVSFDLFTHSFKTTETKKAVLLSSFTSFSMSDRGNDYYLQATLSIVSRPVDFADPNQLGLGGAQIFARDFSAVDYPMTVGFSDLKKEKTHFPCGSYYSSYRRNQVSTVKNDCLTGDNFHPVN